MVSPSICLLMAGVAGIFLFIGLRARKGSKSKERKSVVVDDNHCACCLAPLLISRGVRCNDCGAKTCRKSCSRWDTSDNAWNCIFCNQRRAWMRRNEKWFENFGSTTNEKEDSFLHSFFGTVKSQVIAGHAVAKNMEQIQEDQEEKRTVHVIRNFVEKIVEGLIENVDDTSINRLYKNSEYEKFLEEHRPPLITALTQLATCLETSLTNKPSMDPPATAHAALKEIVERAVEEARKLPGLGSSTDTEHPREGRPIADNSYEDLLATAILNKVVEKFQRERVDGNSNVLHDTDSPKAKYTTESEHGLEEDAVSYESYHRECSGNRSASIRRNVDNREPVSFMMEEQIEEVTTITSDDDEFRGNDIMEFECTRRVPFPELGMDIIDPPRELSSSSDSSDLDRNEYSPARTKRHVADRAMDLISPVESWEDNWLFQKKRTSRTQPDAVSMLVPSSNAYYKALIGDKDAEDTSDLSECSSTKSDEEIEKELMEAINNVVPRTPKTSESDAKKNQTENNQEVPNVTHIENDEIGVCQTKIEIEKNLSEKVCEHFDEKIKEKLLKSSKISEKKIIKDENDKEKLSESSFMLITAAKEEDKTKEKPKDTTDCGERIFLESSVRKNANTQFEKSSERNDRPENVADEDEEQRESEYTEHYDTAIQRHLDSLTKVEICFGENEMIETCKTMNEQFKELINDSIEEQGSERSQTEVQLSYVTTDENHIDITAENDRLSAPPRPGTIAEREHKKWENAPPIENNPYSEESIRKRCLERQYSKNSDISGVHYDLTKLNEVNLEALTPDRSDIKRFGRDYYINQSKAASGERQEQAIRSTMSSTMSSRPSSSLSQRSSCTGDEQREQQQEESTTSKEIDDISILHEDNDIRMTEELCRKNNAEVINLETNNRVVNSCTSMIDDDQTIKSEKDASDEMTWEDRQRTDNILEDQRKNSKNEINAKLNNQEHSLETECKNDTERKVRRIDLKAYGFENEFTDQKKIIRQQRVVNKLDLKSFGYQNGLHRSCSNNQLDQPLRNNEKSNLIRRTIECREFKGYLIDTPKSLSCKDFAKSSRDLNKLRDKVEEVGLGLISVKSMPNVADEVYYHANPVHVNEKEDQQNELTVRNLLDRVIDKSEEETTMNERDAIVNEDDSVLNYYDEISSDMDRSFEDIYIRSKEQFRGMRREWQTMPSVKRLAEAFGRRQISKTETTVLEKVNRAVAKLDGIKDRSFTPEIQIVEPPKQMHSLTARSLSKEFREGLRQMPSKISSPPVSRSLIEERSTNRTEIVRSKREEDTIVISPDKFKSNIIFWEQMQKRS